jgi:hypothetical protein
VFRFKLHYEDGSEAGDAAYADNVNPGDELMLGPGRFVRVLDVVPVDEEDFAVRRLLKGAGLVASPRVASLSE